ncbi:YlxR domain-containing protein [Candidatus Liberibacter solanacearum]|uniref:Uncharacterized protein n=1 Tax=Candidatus Liberibacter solanacearum TaxID=556287 RepID=A0A0F4VNT1_9HYPH|nr:hypothetical protein DJ66_1082 [Candidatus Liberibacter solanacearum]
MSLSYNKEKTIQDYIMIKIDDQQIIFQDIMRKRSGLYLCFSKSL